jgi:hypothetical protein
LLDCAPRSIEHGNAVSLCSPVDPDKVLQRMLHDTPPGLFCDAFVTPVPALAAGAVVLLPTGRLHHCSTVKAQVPDW